MANEYPDDIISNWSTLIENLEASSLAFYQSIEEGIKKRAVPDVDLTRIDYNESGVLSAKREYLRVTRGSLIFDVCGAPYGTGFFVSWWLGVPKRSIHPVIMVAGLFVYLLLMGTLMGAAGMFVGFLVSLAFIPAGLFAMRYLAMDGTLSDDYVLSIPGIGFLYRKFFRPTTYYSIDTTTMFRTATHAAVLEAVDGLMSAKGLRALSDFDRRPTLRDALQR